jgi:ferritin
MESNLVKQLKLIKQAQDGTADIEPVESITTEPAPESTPEEESMPMDGDNASGDHMTGFLSQNVINMLNQQAGNEMAAAYEYKCAAAWLAGQGFNGFAAWATKQACDEIDHFNKVVDYLVESGSPTDFPAVAKPTCIFDSVPAVVDAIFERERSVTDSWRVIGKQSMIDQDAGTADLAGCFIREQMEEENLVKDITQQLKAAGDGAGLLILNGKLLEQYGE